MEREERERLRQVVAEGERRSPLAARVLERRAQVRADGEEAGAYLAARFVHVRPPGTSGWRVLALDDRDDERLGRMAAAAALPPLTDGQERTLAELAEEVPRAARETRALGGLRRFFSSARRREQALSAARWLTQGYAVWGSDATGRLLERLDAGGREPVLPLSVTQALSPHVGLLDRVGWSGRPGGVVPADGLGGLPAAVAVLAPVITREQQARQAAVEAGEAVRELAVSRLLEQMPLDRLREATRERLRVGTLLEAGVRSVKDVLDRGMSIQQVPGVGEVTARRTLGAAETLRTLAREDAVVTLDAHDRTPQAAHLLAALHTWEVLRQAAKARDVVAVAQALQPLAARTNGATTHLAVLGAAGADELLDLARPLAEHATELDEQLDWARRADPWKEFLRRPADFFSLLSELGLVEETDTYGELPDDVVAAVREQELDATHLRVSLRGYQSFGARFALVQKKVLIGDEMGLGKTIEALAALAHLASEGGRWFLVVCPASVLTNWVREVRQRTDLVPRKVHGPLREMALEEWRREGGVAVTTYATLGRVWEGLDGFELDALVVDEAHYVKNPGAKRSDRVGRLAARTEHVMLLTGTPLENRVEEFRALVGYLRPDLLDGDEDSPVEFRRAVAPVYLRRNTEDVLVELPELVEVDEWLELSEADQVAYREAVAEGSFMAMRRAAFVAGERSAKLERLVEIVEEAAANGRRVLVFSYFLDVLDQVVEALPDPVYGPLTGAVPPEERQAVIDTFALARSGASLVAQVQAGGVGLNIQAASVVVICEPQVKPTTEWQAIARARRMGQLESVQVHRLLAEDSVDERMVEILSGKSELFHDFARVSETARSAPEAYDVSEADLARRVVAAERERLFPEEAEELPDAEEEVLPDSLLREPEPDPQDEVASAT